MIFLSSSSSSSSSTTISITTILIDIINRWLCLSEKTSRCLQTLSWSGGELGEGKGDYIILYKYAVVINIVWTLCIYHSILAIWETMMSFLKTSTILTNHYFIKNDRKSHCALYRSSTVEEEMLALHPVRWQLQSPQYSDNWIFFDISSLLLLQWGPPVSKVSWPHRPNVSPGMHV